MGEQLVKRK